MNTIGYLLMMALGMIVLGLMLYFLWLGAKQTKQSEVMNKDGNGTNKDNQKTNV